MAHAAVAAMSSLPARHHLFAVDGTALPAPILLMAKLVAATFLIAPHLPVSEPFLPFWQMLDAVPHSAFRLFATVLFVGAALSLLFNLAVRASSFIAGTTILFCLLAAKPFYANNILYGALLLILTGLYEPILGAWPLRLQPAIMYLGAGLNKALEADWRSGQFFYHWFGEIHHHHWFLQVSAAFPPLVFAKTTTWGIIGIELLFVPLLLFRKTWPVGAWLVIAYHATILALTGSTFGVFDYCIAASMLVYAEWPRPPIHATLGSGLPESLRRLLDPDQRFRPLACAGTHVLTLGADREEGWLAAMHTLLLSPTTYFVLLILIKLPDSLFHLRRFAILAVMVFAPLALHSTWKLLRPQAKQAS